jgi:hypothetical protein
MSLQQSAGPGPRTRRADGDNTSALSGPRVREPTLAAHSRAAAGDLVKGPEAWCTGLRYQEKKTACRIVPD